MRKYWHPPLHSMVVPAPGSSFRCSAWAQHLDMVGTEAGRGSFSTWLPTVLICCCPVAPIGVSDFTEDAGGTVKGSDKANWF